MSRVCSTSGVVSARLLQPKKILFLFNMILALQSMEIYTNCVMFQGHRLAVCVSGLPGRGGTPSIDANRKIPAATVDI